MASQKAGSGITRTGLGVGLLVAAWVGLGLTPVVRGQPFVEIGGRLRFEAENFDARTSSVGGFRWAIVPDENPGLGYVNDSGACGADGAPRHLVAEGGLDVRFDATEFPDIDRFATAQTVSYEFRIHTAGTYAVWTRFTGSSDKRDDGWQRIRELVDDPINPPRMGTRLISFDLTDNWDTRYSEFLEPGLYHLDIAASRTEGALDAIILDSTGTFDGTDAGAARIPCSPRCDTVSVVSHLPSNAINFASVDVPTRIGIAVALPSTGEGTVTIASSDASVAGGAEVNVTSAGGTCFGAVLDVLAVGSTTLTLENTLGLGNSAQGREINVIAVQGLELELAFASMEPGDTQSGIVTGNFAAAGTRDLTAPPTTYASSDEGVATVSADGIVTAVGVGAAEITATNGGVSGTATVAVAEQVTKIAFMVGGRLDDLSDADQAQLAYLRSLRFAGDPGQVVDTGGLAPQVALLSDGDFDQDAIDAGFDLLVTSPTINSGRVASRFRCRSIPHVFSNPGLHRAALEGMAEDGGSNVDPDVFADIFIVDGIHPITQGLPVDVDGFLEIYTSPQSQSFGLGALGPDVRALADTGDEIQLFILLADAGTSRVDGESTFLGRRAFIGLSPDSFDDLNDTGRTIYRRSLDWALGGERLPCETVVIEEPYVEIGGIVRFEAENFDSRQEGVGSSAGDNWMIVPDEDTGRNYINDTGDCNADGMPRHIITPGGDNRVQGTDKFAHGPTVNYTFQITTAGDYEIWTRTVARNTGSDSGFQRLREDPSVNVVAPPRVGFANTNSNFAEGWDTRYGLFLEPGIYHYDVAPREHTGGIDAFIIALAGAFDGTDAGAAAISCSPRCAVVDLVSHLPAEDIHIASVDVPRQLGISVAIPAAADGTVRLISSDPSVVANVDLNVTVADGRCFGAVVTVDIVGSTTLTLENDMGFANSAVGRRITVIAPQALDLVLATAVLEPGDMVGSIVIGDFGLAGTRNLTDSATGTIYASSNTNVVTVDENGRVTAVGLGTADITVTNGVSTTRSVVVADQVTKIAFLVGDTDLGEGDQAVVDHLVGLEFAGDPGQTAAGGLPPQVLLFDDDNFDAQALDAGFDLLVTSSTVDAANIGGQFRCLTIPHIFWDAEFNQPDREGLTDGGGTVLSTTDCRDGLFVVDNAHPITDGRTVDECLPVFTDPDQMLSIANSGPQTAGTLAPGARVLAESFFDEGTIVVAETGGLRVDKGSVFRGRRVFLWLGDETFDNANDTGRELLTRSVDWALAGARTIPAPAAVRLFATAFATVGTTSPLQVDLGSADGECVADAAGDPQTVYSVDDPTVATIDAAGVVTALRAGVITIGVENGGLADQAVMTVIDAPPSVVLDFDTAGSAFDFEFIGLATDTWSVEANPLNGNSLALRSNSGAASNDAFGHVAVVKATVFQAFDAEASVDVTWDNDDDRAGIYLRFVDPGNWYYLLVEADDNPDDQIRLYRSRDGNIERLVQEIFSQVVDIDGRQGETHTITFRVEGDQFFGQIDGLPMPGLNPFVDPAPLLAVGRAGVGQNSNPSYFDNLSLMASATQPPAPAPALVSIMGGLGGVNAATGLADTFISPLGEDVPFDTIDLDLSVDSDLVSGAGLTLTSNGGGNHTLTLDMPVPVGDCVTLTFDVADAATGAVGTISFTSCHLPLDVNQDGQVNIQDITAWGAEFNGNRRAALVDTNGDGNVNVQDATRVGDMWFGRPPATRPWNGAMLP